MYLLIVVQSPETINLAADEKGQRLHPFYEIGKLMSEAFRCITVAILERAIKGFEMGDPWPFKQNPGVRSRGRSRWNVLPGTGPPGHFMSSGVHIRIQDILSETWSSSNNKNAEFAARTFC